MNKDEGKKDDDKNPFAKATPEQRKTYREALDAADSADGTVPDYPREFQKIATQAGAMSDTEFQTEKGRVFDYYAREGARARLVAEDRETAERAINGLA